MDSNYNLTFTSESGGNMNIITREYHDNDITIYRRTGNPLERGFMNKYFEAKNNQSTGKEFKTRSQVVSYLKKLGKI